MEIIRKLIHYQKGDVFHLYGTGDIHGGTQHCAEEKVKRKFHQITEDPFGLWVDMGDKVDCVTPNDPRFQLGIMSPWIHPDNIAEDEKNWYCDLASPAVKAQLPYDKESRCLGSIEGNHEGELKKHHVADMQTNICKALDIPNLGFSCIYHLVFKRVNSNETHMFRLYITHGSGGAQTKGGKMQKLRKIMGHTDTDITLVGHMHDIITDSQPVLSSGQNLKLKGKERIGAITGSFLRTYTQGVEAGYGERRNYEPVSLGCVMLEIRPQDEIVTVKPSYA